MKFFICALALVAAASAAPQVPVPVYNPQIRTPEGAAQIRSYNDEKQENGAYAWNFETDNGIIAGETNSPVAAPPNGEPAPDVQGGYQYTAPDGQVIKTTYVAGPGGFIPQGSHIHPIPEAILRSLAWNAAHPEEEAQWDAAYNKPIPPPGYYAPQ